MKLSFAFVLMWVWTVPMGSDLFARTEKSMVGQALPKLSVQWLDKKPETEGKPMIVEFWATWCPPCRSSIPHLNEIYAKYKDKGLQIVGITDEDRAKIKKFEKEVPIEYAVALDANGKYAKPFGIQGIPHAVLVDKTGKVVWEGHPMSLKESQIEELLK
ncbi:MAG: TlpA family protein disulfide reductase [Verrucomicrobia bacterium]|nr:TlpA family protein disulfide reductase [Verrucomicrobiota bacterium]